MATSTEVYSKKFAQAFLKALDVDVQTLRNIEQELVDLSLLAKEPLISFFLNPVFHLDEKKSVIEEIFSKHKFHNETKQFVQTLLSLNQLSLLETVAVDFSSELREKNNEEKIEVSTAFPMSSVEQEKIRATFEKVTGKTVLLNVNVDPNLIGGIRANVGGVVYDSSIEGHLLRLQKEFA